MGDPKALNELAEEIINREKEDLVNNRLRVVNYCYTCPFCKTLSEKELSGNPKYKCDHPATYVHELNVNIDQFGYIPTNCPLRTNPITIFLNLENKI